MCRSTLQEYKHSPLFLISSFILSGIIGVLIKHGLQQVISALELEQPFHVLPANMIGCFLLGFLTNIFPSSLSITSTVGSISSFAEWNQAVATAIQDKKYLSSFFSLLAGVELSCMSYKVGLDAAEMLVPEGYKLKHGCYRGVIFFGYSLYILVVFFAMFDAGRRQLWLACIIAPQGVWIRDLLIMLNHPDFPIGTWITNIVASALWAGLSLQGSVMGLVIERGFVDSMGTVSTVIAEAHSLRHDEEKTGRAYLYVFSMLFVCLLVACVISSAGFLTIVKTAQEYLLYTS